jgi:hypothetical protein
MRRFLSVPYAVAVSALAVLAAAVVWGPLQPAHGQRHVLTQTIALTGKPGISKTALSPAFSLGRGSIVVSAVATPLPGSGRQTLPPSYLATVQVAFVTSGSRGEAPSAGLSFMNDERVNATTLSADGIPHGGRVQAKIEAASMPRSEIVITVSQRRVFGGMADFWIVVLVCLAYVGLAVELLRRQYPPSPILVANPLHEKF